MSPHRDRGPGTPPSDCASLSMLEIGAGQVFGLLDIEVPTRTAAETPRKALEALVLPALERPPCIVTFSGGVDSSTVLAVAADVARRHQLPPPVPFTWRFPHLAASDESSFQEAVIRMLHLEDWIIEEPGDEFDVLGPTAYQANRRYGLLYPFNSFVHLRVIERARSGSVLTGAGGDEMLREHRFRSASYLLAGRSRITLSGLRTVLAASAPRRLRQRRALSQFRAPLPWLRPRAQAQVDRRLEELMPVDLWYDDAVRMVPRLRYLDLSKRQWRRVAADHDVTICHPLTEARFADALAADGGRTGYGGRSRAVQRIVGDLLPEEVLHRTSKASFAGAFWTAATTATAQMLPFDRLDMTIFDVEALRREWSSDRPHPKSYLLAQHLQLLAEDRAGG